MNETSATQAVYSAATCSGVSVPVIRPMSRISSLALTLSALETSLLKILGFQQLSRNGGSQRAEGGEGAQQLPGRR